MDDPGKLRVSTSALLYIQCSITLTGMFVVFLTGMFVVVLTVDDLHLLGVLVFGCVARCNG